MGTNNRTITVCAVVSTICLVSIAALSALAIWKLNATPDAKLPTTAATERPGGGRKFAAVAMSQFHPNEVAAVPEIGLYMARSVEGDGQSSMEIQLEGDRLVSYSFNGVGLMPRGSFGYLLLGYVNGAPQDAVQELVTPKKVFTKEMKRGEWTVSVKRTAENEVSIHVYR